MIKNLSTSRYFMAYSSDYGDAGSPLGKDYDEDDVSFRYLCFWFEKGVCVDFENSNQSVMNSSSNMMLQNQLLLQLLLVKHPGYTQIKMISREEYCDILYVVDAFNFYSKTFSSW